MVDVEIGRRPSCLVVAAQSQRWVHVAVSMAFLAPPRARATSTKTIKSARATRPRCPAVTRARRAPRAPRASCTTRSPRRRGGASRSVRRRARTTRLASGGISKAETTTSASRRRRAGEEGGGACGRRREVAVLWPISKICTARRCRDHRRGVVASSCTNLWPVADWIAISGDGASSMHEAPGTPPPPRFCNSRPRGFGWKETQLRRRLVDLSRTPGGRWLFLSGGPPWLGHGHLLCSQTTQFK